MTTSTSVERRRRLARRVLLSLSTIVCSGLGFASIASAQDAPPKTFAMTATGVNLLNLSYVNEVNDLSIGPLRLTRSYISGKVDSSKYFGYSWTHNFDIWARQYTRHVYSYTDAQNVTEVLIGRSVHRFYGLATGSYPPAPENDETGTTVTSSGGAIIFNDRDGTVYRFGGGGAVQKIASITSPDGSTLSFGYASGVLKTVTSNRGYALVFDYANGVVSAACGYNLSSTVITTGSSCAGSTVKTSYGYNGTTLTSAVNPVGQATQYRYTVSSDNVPVYLTCVTDPGASACKIANTWTFRNDIPLTIMTQQVAADGSTWKFDCSCGSVAKSDPDETQPVEWTSMTDPSNNGTYAEFTAGVLSKHVDENGNTYPLSYFGRLPTMMTYPQGNKVLWNYNPYTYAETSRVLKAKPNTGLADITQDAKTYPSSYNAATRDKPIAVTDANSNETDYGYRDFGSVDWALQPPPTSGAARPLKLYDYVLKSAYVKNGSGSLSPTSAPVWLPYTETQCQTSSGIGPGQPGGRPSCDAGAPVMTTTYEYGADGTADNLLLRGKVVTANGQSLRTCYRYDTLGNKTSETSPRAGLTSCPA